MREVYCIVVQYQVFYRIILFPQKKLIADTFYLLILICFITDNNFFTLLVKKLSAAIF
jgi:hypothetical protein